jgi:two-component system C4-dicarboxylate transport sensor histidine kinase DctB
MRIASRTAKTEQFVVLSTPSATLREEVKRLYVFMVASLLLVYGLVVIALELFVLPKGVYLPIRRMLRADEAVQSGRAEAEIIPEREIPGDELGAIMRSRNDTVTRLRTQEKQTSAALLRIEEIAGDLKRKNELLEAAQRNLADADRLAALGVLSAGIAHELNTPLAVVKGLAEKVRKASISGSGLSESDAALLVRVVGRLERLSEGLLDYARVRPPQVTQAHIHALAEEAITLVRLDREAVSVTLRNEIDPALVIACDENRITQVFVNLLRNAVDAISSARRPGVVVIRAASLDRGDGRRWCSITISDNGPGIAPDVLARLFEPFVTTRLDAKGTGLGLAVAEGIVREHGGVLAAKNRTDPDLVLGASGAQFEVLLPADLSVANWDACDPTQNPS